MLGVAGACLAPLATRAQQRRVPEIGYMSGGSAGFYAPTILPAFRDGLRESGFVEGQNVAIEYRWAEGHYEQLPGFAAEFVGRNVDLIAATGGVASSRAAKQATATIPIVFTSGGDPVADGLIASLARPGGNLTGVSFLTSELHPKRLELVSELVPQARVIGFLVNPNGPFTEHVVREAAAAAEARGVALKVVNVTGGEEFDAAFASLARIKIGAVIVETDPLIDARREELVRLAALYAIPAIYGFRVFAASGGLISYGVSIAGVYRQVGVYAGKILAGARPADLPVVQPTKFELVINLKTAKSLGLAVPQSLLARADEVIE